MTGVRAFSPKDWDAVRLVALDVDGTLYRQGALRARMAASLIGHAVRHGSVQVPRVLQAYRKAREKLAEIGATGFDEEAFDRTARSTGVPSTVVRAIVADWIEDRPLRHLVGCRYGGVRTLFSALRGHRITIGILSDYPAVSKIRALGLDADHVVCASDEGVGTLKPSPVGLLELCDRAGVPPHRTLVIGDRPERDGLSARKAGAPVLIRSDRPVPAWQSFRRYDDPIFAPLLGRARRPAAVVFGR